MEAQPPLPATQTTTNGHAPPTAAVPLVVPLEERPWLKFPPFPAVPDGVALVPFKDFKPLGIHVPQDPPPDYVEVSAQTGVPTVTLRVHHDLTAMEKRKKKPKNRVGASGILLRQAWYDEWAETEHLRRTTAPVDM